jgi:hypothetical protein
MLFFALEKEAEKGHHKRKSKNKSGAQVLTLPRQNFGIAVRRCMRS